jgi:serine/threonine protein kinase, bacterial
MWGPPRTPPRSRKPWLWVGASAVVVLAVVTGAVIWFTRPAPKPNPTVTLTELNDGVLIGYPDVPVTIDVFDEPICPPCSKFVTSSTPDIQRAVNDKKIAVRFHLLNFLDRKSGSGDYSTRAIAASYCVAETKDPQLYINFYVDMFASNFQPAEGARSDRTDDELAHLAETVGASGDVADCIGGSGRMVNTARTKAANAEATVKRFSHEVATPAVFNGATSVDISQPGWVDSLTRPS